MIDTDADTTDTTDTVDDTVDTSAADDQTDDTADTSTTDDKAGDDGKTLLGDDAEDDEGGDDKGEDDGDGETPAGAPEKYEFTLKDAEGNDMPLDEELATEADPILRELNLSNEQANKLVALAPKMLAKGQQSAIEQITEAGAAQRKTWLDAFKADPDLGGANEKTSLAAAATGMDAMGFTKGSDFRKLMDETGLGNHPEMIRTFKTLGELAGEDGTFARSSSASEKETAGWEDRYKQS